MKTTMKCLRKIIIGFIAYLCMNFSVCGASGNNVEDAVKLEKFGISEKSINKFFSTGLYKGILDDGKPILVLAMISDILPSSSIDIGLFYKLIDGKKIELGMNIMNPPFVLGFDGMYENGKLNGFTLVRYFEITKINDSTYNKPYLAFIYKKKIDKY